MTEVTLNKNKITVDVDFTEKLTVMEANGKTVVKTTISISDKIEQLRNLNAGWEKNLDYYLNRTEQAELWVELVEENITVVVGSDWALKKEGSKSTNLGISNIETEVNYEGDLETLIVTNTI